MTKSIFDELYEAKAFTKEDINNFLFNKSLEDEDFTIRIILLDILERMMEDVQEENRPVS